MPSLLNTTMSPRRGCRERKVMPSIIIWSPAETEGVIAPVGTENGRTSPQMRSIISAPTKHAVTGATPITTLLRRLVEARGGWGNGGGLSGCSDLFGLILGSW